DRTVERRNPAAGEPNDDLAVFELEGDSVMGADAQNSADLGGDGDLTLRADATGFLAGNTLILRYNLHIVVVPPRRAGYRQAEGPHRGCVTWPHMTLGGASRAAPAKNDREPQSGTSNSTRLSTAL